MSTKRPISLEIRVDLPDDRDALSSKDPHHAGQTHHLEDSIDALLDEIDEACASVENPNASKPKPKRLDQSEEPAGPGSESTDLTTDADDQPHETQATLDALHAVEKNAQSLIEDTIDELLDETGVPQDTAAEPEIKSDAELNDELIDAALDALESTKAPEPSGDVPAPTTSTDAIPDPDELLGEIADELTHESLSTDGAETQPDEPSAQHTAADEPISSTDLDLIDDAVSELLDEAPEAIKPVETAEQDEETMPDAAGPQQPAGGAASEEPSAKLSEAEAASTLADLDATLAGMDDELLMGDFEAPDGELVHAESMQDHDASALLEQLGMDDLCFDDESMPASTGPAPEAGSTHSSVETITPEPAETSARPAGVPPSEQASTTQRDAQSSRDAKPKRSEAQTGSETDAETETETETQVRSIWETARCFIMQRAARAWVLTRVHAVPLGARVVLAVNKPVKDRPAQLRDSIGYLALWTLLLAAILWVYLAFIRTTPTPTPTQAPTRVVERGEIVDPMRAAGSRP